jgi:hypothetical protein
VVVEDAEDEEDVDEVDEDGRTALDGDDADDEAVKEGGGVAEERIMRPLARELG